MKTLSKETRMILVKYSGSIHSSHPQFPRGIWGNEIPMCSFCVTPTVWPLCCCTAVIEGLAECAVPCNTYSTYSQHFSPLLHMYYFSQLSFLCNYTHLHKGIALFPSLCGEMCPSSLTHPNWSHAAALAQCAQTGSSFVARTPIKETHSVTVMQHHSSPSYCTTIQSVILMAPKKLCWSTWTWSAWLKGILSVFLQIWRAPCHLTPPQSS